MTIEKVFQTPADAKKLSGRLYRHEGALYRVVSVTNIGRSLTYTDQVVATLELRPATEVEQKAAKIAQLEKEIDQLYTSSDPTDPRSNENKETRRRLQAEVEQLRKA